MSFKWTGGVLEGAWEVIGVRVAWGGWGPLATTERASVVGGCKHLPSGVVSPPEVVDKGWVEKFVGSKYLEIVCVTCTRGAWVVTPTRTPILLYFLCFTDDAGTGPTEWWHEWADGRGTCTTCFRNAGTRAELDKSPVPWWYERIGVSFPVPVSGSGYKVADRPTDELFVVLQECAPWWAGPT